MGESKSAAQAQIDEALECRRMQEPFSNGNAITEINLSFQWIGASMWLKLFDLPRARHL